MRYLTLGRSGLRVSEFCLGTMTFGTDWGWGADFAASAEIFELYAEAGGNFIDTADAYTNGSSERFLSKLLAHDREHFVVATKYSMSKGTDISKSGNSRKNMVRCLDDSLRRLETDYVDIFLLHFWDSTTPIEEVLTGFELAIRSGKARYVGFSNTPSWIVSRAYSMWGELLRPSLASLQIAYHLGERSAERDLLPMAAALGLGVTAYSPLGGGLLTGKYTQAERTGRLEGKPVTNRMRALVEEVLTVAQQLDITPSQVALAWIHDRQRHPRIISILGARTARQLRENLGAVAVELDPTIRARLDDAGKIELGHPHDVLANPATRRHATGGHEEALDTML